MDRKELLSKISREWRELSSSEKQRFKHEAARKMREWKFDKREEYRAAFAKAIGRRQGGFGVYKNQLTPYNFYLKEKVPQLIQEKKKNGEELVQKEIFKTVAEQWGLQEDMTKWREQSDKDADRYEEEVENFNANNNNEGDYLDGDLRENPTEILIENNKRSLGEQMQNIPLLQGSENYPHRMYPSNLNLVVPSSSNHDESRTGIDSDFKMPKAKPPKIIMDAPVIEAEEGDLDALFGGSEEAEGEDQEDNIDIDIGSEDSDDNQDNPNIPEDEDEIHPSPNPEYDHIEEDKEMEAVDIKNDFKMPTGRDINDISKVKGIKAKSHFDMNILKDYKSEISFGLTEKSEEKSKEDSKK